MNNTFKQKTIYTFIFMMISIWSNAQIGARLGYNLNSFDSWKSLEQHTKNNDFQSSGIEIGLNYWYKLPKVRLEFLPEVVMGTHLGSTVNHLSLDKALKYNYFDFRLNTQIYPVDFRKDCDCPTFSDKKSIGDGLYISLVPGVRFSSKSIDTKKDSNIAYNIGMGLGYDIHFRDNIYFSPSVSYRFNLQDQWQDQLFQDLSSVEKENWNNLDLSFRVIYKLPKKKRQMGLFK